MKSTLLRASLPALLLLSMAGIAQAATVTCPDSSTLECPDNASCVDDNGTNVCACDTGYTELSATECAENPLVSIGTPADGATLTTATPSFSGTANPGSDPAIELFDSADALVVIGNATADASGAWSWTVPSTDALDEGDYRARITVDLNNTLAAAVEELDFTIDLSTGEPTDPEPPVIAPDEDGLPDWSGLRSDVDATGGRVFGNCAQSSAPSLAGAILGLMALGAFVSRRRREA